MHILDKVSAFCAYTDIDKHKSKAGMENFLNIRMWCYKITNKPAREKVPDIRDLKIKPRFYQKRGPKRYAALFF
jgi:hypothetical protein